MDMNVNKYIKLKYFITVEIDFHDRKWHKNKVPSLPGWYYISTTCPVEEFKKLKEPKEKGNYNLSKKIVSNKFLIDKNIAINQKSDEMYIVYSGHAKNLLNREREHSFGGNGTGCLAIAKYDELIKYDWTFSFLTFNSVFNDIEDDKNARVCVEQLFRSKYGWPILCSQ